jgi:DNA primase
VGKGVWHCFVCGAGGNAIDLWVAVTKQDLHAAVLDLCSRLGRDVPWLLPRARRQGRSQETGEQSMPDP